MLENERKQKERDYGRLFSFLLAIFSNVIQNVNLFIYKILTYINLIIILFKIMSKYK